MGQQHAFHIMAIVPLLTTEPGVEDVHLHHYVVQAESPQAALAALDGERIRSYARDCDIPVREANEVWCKPAGIVCRAEDFKALMSKDQYRAWRARQEVRSPMAGSPAAGWHEQISTGPISLDLEFADMNRAALRLQDGITELREGAEGYFYRLREALVGEGEDQPAVNRPGG